MELKKEFSKTVYALVISILFLYSCAGDNFNKESLSSDSLKQITLHSFENTLVDSSFFNDLQVVFLETNISSLHQRIDKIFIDDDRIFVFDKSMSKVIVYDSKGKYLSNLHNIGRGPTEYTAVNDVFVDAKTQLIHLLCDYPFKIMSYDYDMRLKNETKIDKLYLEFVADGDNFYCRRAETENNEVNDFYLDIVSRHKQEVVTSLLPIHAGIQDLNKLNISGSMLTKSSSVLMSTFDDNVIHEVNGSKSKGKYIVNLEADSISKQYDQIVNMVDLKNSLLFKSKKGLFLYDKEKEILKGYKYGVMNTGILNSTLSQFLPIGNETNKVAFVHYPAMLKMAEEAIREKLSTMESKPENINDRFLTFASKVNLDDNPILFIYSVD